MITVGSIKAKLKIQAKKHNRIFQEVLVMYGLERTLYRLSISEYRDKFTLKGGIFLYGLFQGNFARATTDIDLLAQMTSNEPESMKTIFTEIFSIEVDDALRYDLGVLDVHKITEFKEYQGVNVSIVAYLDKTKIPISIDIGFGDIVFPERTLMEFPVILTMDAPTIYAYSYQSVVAEKFEAIVSLGYANSRHKDFYDIYLLATSYSFNGGELTEALIKTFSHRKTRFEDIVAFEDDFSNDAQRKIRWNSFVKKKKAMGEVDLLEAINVIRDFLSPIVDEINSGRTSEKIWNYKERKWTD